MNQQLKTIYGDILDIGLLVTELEAKNQSSVQIPQASKFPSRTLLKARKALWVNGLDTVSSQKGTPWYCVYIEVTYQSCSAFVFCDAV